MSPARGGPLRRTWSAFLGITLGRLLRWALYLAVVATVLAVAGFVVFVLFPVKTIPAYEKVDDYAYLDQGWGSRADSPDRQTYYYTRAGHFDAAGRLDRRRCATTGS